MVASPSIKFNVAWFKLAEFVSRKEKERAFAIYRLLVHSLDDNALSAQLEGDLLLAFNDDKALYVYERAAQLYESSGRITQALFLYERIIALSAPTIDRLTKMLALYQQGHDEGKLARCAAILIRLFLENNQREQADGLLHNLVLSSYNNALLYEAYTLYLLQTTALLNEFDLICTYIQVTMDGFLTNHADKRMTLFLSKIAAINDRAYTYACNCITNEAAA